MLARCQVVESKVVLDRAKGPRSAPLKVAECLVGDASGVIVFTARNEQGQATGNVMCCHVMILQSI